MQRSFDRWEAEDREKRKKASIKELEALPNLACLEIDIKDPSILTQNMPLLSKKIVRFIIRTSTARRKFPIFRIFSKDNVPFEFSKAIRIRLKRETRLGDWIETQLLRDTEYLYLHGCAHNLNLTKSQNIKWLKLKECESMKSISRTSGDDDATVFPSLEYLDLYSLTELQEICDGPISATCFDNLKELNLTSLRALTQFWKSRSVCENNDVPHFSNLFSIDISYCDSLRNLGQLSMAGKDCLPQLTKLHISECEMMEQVFLWNDENKTAIELQRKRHDVITKVFPKLKNVWLVSLRNLTTFYQGIQRIEFPLLKDLKIEECPKMKSMIGSSSADIDDDASLHLFCQPQKVSFSSLEELEMYDNPLCGHEIPSSLFNGLKFLTINKYEGSMSIFTLSVAANLVSLRKLHIENCDEMTKVIEDEQQRERILVFPKLEELHLKKLPKLVSFCDSKCEGELPLLRRVVIYDCPNMKNFSLVLVHTPNSEAFTTDLSTYVGVGADVAFNSLKELDIRENKNPFDHHKISVSLFNELEWLMFYRLKGSVSLFSSSAVGSLVNLKVLHIEKCDEMLVKVIEDGEEEEDGKVVIGDEIITSVVIFPKLEELHLYGLYNIVRFCEWKCDVQLPSLREVKINYCPYMENFSMGIVSAPNLKIVQIEYEEIEATKDLNRALQQHYLARQEKVRTIQDMRKSATEISVTKS